MSIAPFAAEMQRSWERVNYADDATGTHYGLTLDDLLVRLRRLGPVQGSSYAAGLLSLIDRDPGLRRKLTGADLAMLEAWRHRDGGRRDYAQFDESEHPRDSSSGEFIEKMSASYKASAVGHVAFKMEPQADVSGDKPRVRMRMIGEGGKEVYVTESYDTHGEAKQAAMRWAEKQYKLRRQGRASLASADDVGYSSVDVSPFVAPFAAAMQESWASNYAAGAYFHTAAGGAWDESEHPRDKNTGEFTDKMNASYESATAPASPAKSKKTFDESLSKLQGHYEGFAGVSHGEIGKTVEDIGKAHSKSEIDALAKAFGIYARYGSKQATLDAIRRKISERKESAERIDEIGGPSEDAYKRARAATEASGKKPDQAVVNLPMNKRGEGNIDSQLDKYKGSSAAKSSAVINAQNMAARRREQAQREAAAKPATDKPTAKPSAAAGDPAARVLSLFNNVRDKKTTREAIDAAFDDLEANPPPTPELIKLAAEVGISRKMGKAALLKEMRVVVLQRLGAWLRVHAARDDSPVPYAAEMYQSWADAVSYDAPSPSPVNIDIDATDDASHPAARAWLTALIREIIADLGDARHPAPPAPVVNIDLGDVETKLDAVLAAMSKPRTIETTLLYDDDDKITGKIEREV